MNYGSIKKHDIANGLGVRVSLFVSGCTHHCPGCFNQETWDFNYGIKYTSETQKEIIEALNHEYISGLTLIGGEPFEPSNQEVLVGLVKEQKIYFLIKIYGVIQAIILKMIYYKIAGYDVNLQMNF